MIVNKFRIKSVQGNVYALITIALLSVIGLIGSNILIVRQLHNIHTSVSHEYIKLELNSLLHNRLLNLRMELQALSMDVKTREIAFHYNNAKVLTRDVEDILHILEHGGTIETNYDVNFGNKDKAVLSLTYHKTDASELDMVIIELKSHLDELKGVTTKLDQLIKDRLKAIAAGNQEERVQLDRELVFFYKDIQPFFSRILESANRISFESSVNLEIADKVRQQSIRRAIVIICALATGGLLCLVLIGTVLVKNINRIVREREEALLKTRKINEHLEQSVEDRTRKLKQSNEELRLESRERHQAQQEVVKQIKFLYDTINALSHPFYVIDVKDYSLLLYNKVVERLGTPNGATCYQLTHRQDTPCCSQEHPCPLQKVMRTGKPFTVDHVHFDKDGNKIYVEVHAYPIFDDQGNVIQMIEYSLDVTAKKLAEKALVKLNEELENRVEARTRALVEEVRVRKQAEEAMEKSVRHFRFLIEHAPGVVMIINTGGFVEYVSPSIEEMTGYPVDKFIHSNLFSFTHDEDEHKLDSISNMEIGGEEKVTCEFRFMNSSGDWIVVDSVIVNRLGEPSIEGIVMNLWDVTKRKQLEMQTQWLSQAVEQSPNTVVITDTYGNIEYVNASFVTSTGYTAEEAMGQNPRILKSGKTPEGRYTELWETITAGKQWTGEFINKRKNGELFTESVIISPLRNERGKVTHYLATKENVTELKKAHEQAKEASKAKSVFLANMSHEIRTPLNGIVGFVDLLASKERDPEHKKYIEIIKSSSIHLLHIIDDILDLSKVESGKLELDLQKTLIRIKLEPAIELFYAKATEKNIDFFSFIDPALPQSVICDILRINQVMANLINNAIKFTPEGGRVDVSVKVTEVQDESIRIRFAVTDTGIGMDEEAQAKVFESFSQADVSTTRKFGGSGLGLSISKQLVEMMGGQLLLTSEPDKGSTFYFELTMPLDKESEQELEETKWLNQIQSIGILVTGQNESQEEEHVRTYLNSMGIKTVFFSMADNWMDFDLIIVVVYDLDNEDIRKLYEVRNKNKCILVVQPGELPGIEARYPGVKTITKPLNPSKIYDVVASAFGYRKPIDSTSEDKEGEDFSGRRVLVAEDNLVNQELILILLEDLKVDFELAANGLEVVEKFKKSDFDLVLMDVNMPEMDGIKATGEIIAYEQKNNLSHVPIVALTAHALKGDRARMLDAGMDNYLSKPIDRGKLVSVFSHYLGDPASAPFESLKPAMAVNYDLEEVAASLGVSLEAVRKIMGPLKKQIESALDTVPVIVADADREEMRNLAHSLAGVAANFRLGAFEACCREIESALRADSAGKENLEELGNRLLLELEATRRLLADVS